jgi:lactoylglutathione lyase
VRFYEALGSERRGRLNFETAYNLYLGLPGDGDTLELTVNRGREAPYDLGEGYNHMALIVDDLDAKLIELGEFGSGRSGDARAIEPNSLRRIGLGASRAAIGAAPDSPRDRDLRTPQDP